MLWQQENSHLSAAQDPPPVLLCGDKLVGFSADQHPAKAEPCCCVSKAQQARPGDSYGPLASSVPAVVCTITSGSWAPRLDQGENKWPVFWSLLQLLIPSLSHDYSGRERSNTDLIAQSFYLGHPTTIRDSTAHTVMQKVFSLLENNRDNHTISFSNAPHHYFDLLHDQSMFIKSSTNSKADFVWS